MKFEGEQKFRLTHHSFLVLFVSCFNSTPILLLFIHFHRRVSHDGARDRPQPMYPSSNSENPVRYGTLFNQQSSINSTFEIWHSGVADGGHAHAHQTAYYREHHQYTYLTLHPHLPSERHRHRHRHYLHLIYYLHAARHVLAVDRMKLESDIVVLQLMLIGPTRYRVICYLSNL